jgi:hypothetical protein
LGPSVEEKRLSSATQLFQTNFAQDWKDVRMLHRDLVEKRPEDPSWLGLEISGLVQNVW